MLSLECIAQPHIDPFWSVATDRYLMGVLAAQPSAATGFLRVHSAPGDSLSLGRYHLAPDPPAPGTIPLWRRETGGRVLPGGDGFVWVSLLLPHRSALVAAAPLALRPEQVLNRCVRGVLEACRRYGAAVIYPGRDVVTINRRIVAAVSFTTDARGALLFEACLAVGRDFSVMPAWLDAVDPRGTVKGEVLTPDRVTCLTAETGHPLSFAAVVDMLRDGYGRSCGVEIRTRALDAEDREAIGTIAARDAAPARWLGVRQRRPELNRHVVRWAQLGVLEAYLALGEGPVIRDILFAGDFIANPAAIEHLECALRSCPVERRAIASVVERVFSQPENYLLGIGALETIAEMIVRGLE